MQRKMVHPENKNQYFADLPSRHMVFYINSTLKTETGLNRDFHFLPNVVRNQVVNCKSEMQ